MPGAKKTAMTKKTSSKRSKSTKKTKMIPAVRYLRYELTNSGTPGNETSHYIDLARDLSAVNRRLYRQGRDYHVKRVTIVSSNTPNGGDPSGFNNRISLATIPDSWIARSAWERGFKTWTEMNKVASEQISGDISGTWSDFKVFMTTDSRSAFNSGNVLIPKDNGGNNVDLGQWRMSQLVSPDGTTSADPFELHMLGGHSGTAGAWNSVGLLKSYAESRATVSTEDPSVPSEASDDPLVNVFDYGTAIDEVIDNLQTQNDYPPYQQDVYTGETGNMPKPLVVQDTTLVDGKATVGGFTAMCGLIEIESKSPIAEDVYSVLIELAPGKFRGIKAESI